MFSRRLRAASFRPTLRKRPAIRRIHLPATHPLRAPQLSTLSPVQSKPFTSSSSSFGLPAANAFVDIQGGSRHENLAARIRAQDERVSSGFRKAITRLMPWFRGAVLILTAVAGYYHYLAHLEIVPNTGRLRYIRMSKEYEKQLGNDMFLAKLRPYSENIMPLTDPRAQFVGRIMDRIIRSLKPSDYALFGVDYKRDPSMDWYAAKLASGIEWALVVIDCPHRANIVITPNGKCIVFSGILAKWQTDDDMAMMLSHEIAHQLARHIPEGFTSNFIAWPMMHIFVWFDMMPAATRLGKYVGPSLYKSRQIEAEADEIGLRLMAQACFDPRNVSRIWERVDKGKGTFFQRILQAFLPGSQGSHPFPHHRAMATSKGVPKAMEIRKAAGCPDLADVQAFQSAASSEMSV